MAACPENKRILQSGRVWVIRMASSTPEIPGMTTSEIRSAGLRSQTQFERGLAVIGGQGGEACSGENDRKGVGDDLFIVNDKDERPACPFDKTTVSS